MKNNYTTFEIGAQRFCRQTDPRTGTPCISSIHPYDETEYHWARREALKSSLREWRVYRQGKRVCSIWFEGTPLNEDELVARKLQNLDEQAQLERTGGIW